MPDAATAEVMLMQSMSESQRLLFTTEMAGLRKSSSAGVLLALFLGGLGAHRFYLGQTGLGILYVLFCWTFIPAIIALVEAFMMPERVRAYNLQRATETAAKMKALATT